MNNKILISFYPGAGGNRYLNFLNHRPWKELGKTYDNNNRTHFGNKYIEDVFKEDVILTHNVNSITLKSIFSNYKLVHIKSDLKFSLRREWMLEGIKRYCERVETVPNRLDHYNDYKDPRWPDIYKESDLLNLPEHIAIELENNYSQVLNKKNIEFESCLSTIKWHTNYYKENPLDFTAFDEIVDIDSGSEFSTVMKQELLLYHSKLFDEIWESVVG